MINSVFHFVCVSRSWFVSAWLLGICGLALSLPSAIYARQQPSVPSDASIQGQVIDIHGDIVNNATVTLTPASGGRAVTARSNGAGAFVFSALPPGVYRLSVAKPGFTLVERELSLSANEAHRVTLSLSPKGAAESVTVTETGPGYERPQNDFNGLARMSEVQGTTIFAGKKNEVLVLDKLNANLALGNTRQVFAKVPGTNIWENDGSGLQIGISNRGLDPNRSWEVNSRQNGYDITADIFGYPEAYYTPPLEAVERIEVVRGASSLQYGAQFGGIVNYVLREAPPDRRLAFNTEQTGGTNGLFNSHNWVGRDAR